jgi:predicted signal transduction protein with EAL and GGDEF domain
VASRLLESLEAPLIVAGTPVTVGASIGIAIDSPTMTHVDQLLADADIAMYQAKAHGKGRHQVFDPTAADAGRDEAAATGVGGAIGSTGRSWHDHATVRRPGIGSARPAAEAG